MLSLLNTFKILLVTTILMQVAIACSSKVSMKHRQYQVGIHPELSTYYDKLQELSLDFKGLNSLTFYHEDHRVAGFADFSMKQLEPFVRINTFFWNMYSPTNKLLLVAHEVAHAICGKDHKKGMLDDGCPSHYMNPNMPSNSCTSKHWDTYYNQIRQGCD